jgi:hypothetical protein
MAGRAALARREAAQLAAHRLALEVERLQAQGVLGQAALARALNDRGVPTPRGSGSWTYNHHRARKCARRVKLCALSTVPHLLYRTVRSCDVTIWP